MHHYYLKEMGMMGLEQLSLNFEQYKTEEWLFVLTENDAF